MHLRFALLRALFGTFQIRFQHDQFASNLHHHHHHHRAGPTRQANMGKGREIKDKIGKLSFF
jgi:hypothetical protein